MDYFSLFMYFSIKVTILTFHFQNWILGLKKFHPKKKKKNICLPRVPGVGPQCNKNSLQIFIPVPSPGIRLYTKRNYYQPLCVWLWLFHGGIRAVDPKFRLLLLNFFKGSITIMPYTVCACTYFRDYAIMIFNFGLEYYFGINYPEDWLVRMGKSINRMNICVEK